MKYYAEFETDKYIIENFFPDYRGVMIEVGAGEPECISMSKAFRELQWRTVCIEANPRYVNLHKNLGNEIYHYAVSHTVENNVDFIICEQGNNKSTAMEGLSTSALGLKQKEHKFAHYTTIKVDVITLNWLLEKLGINHIDFVSIDVEGWELEVMKGFDVKKYDPSIILLENFGEKGIPLLKEYNDYMLSVGYELIHNIFYNYIYKK